MKSIDSAKLRRQAFSLAAQLVGQAGAEELVRDLAGAASLRAVPLERWQWIVEHLKGRLAHQDAPGCGKRQWNHIQWLRRQLKMDDDHLQNYIKTVTKIDHPRFLTPELARNVIAGLKQTLKHREHKREQAQFERPGSANSGTAEHAGKME